MPITPLPTAPSRKQSPSAFAENADAFLSQLPTFAAEATTLEQTVNAAEVVVIAAKSSAISARNAAQAAQAAAEAVANATAWDVDEPYTVGQCVYGTDGQTYRAMAASKGVNPVGDETGKWVRISAGGSAVIKSSNFAAVVGHRYMIAPGVECILPATPNVGDQVEVRAAGSRAAVTANPPILRRNGNAIYGDAEDKNLNGLGVIVFTWAGSSYGGWV